MKALVVGGTGFMGRHIVDGLLADGWEVASLSLNDPGGAARAGVHYLMADLRDRQAVQKAIGNTDYEYVVNCGGYIYHMPYFEGGHDIVSQHLGGLQNLVESLNRDSLRCFLNFGSSDEYGGNPAPQNESMREAPISPYSYAKTAATHFLQMLYRTQKLPAVTFRIFLTYGPGQDDRRFIPQIVKGCLRGDRFPTSEGGQLRDFLYVDDLVQAVRILPDCEAAAGEVLNVASGAPVSIRAMIESVQRLVGSGTPAFGEVPYRPGENMELYANTELAWRVLGWKASTGLDEGLTRTIEYYRERLEQ